MGILESAKALNKLSKNVDVFNSSAEAVVENLHIVPKPPQYADDYNQFDVSELAPEEYLRYLSPSKVVEFNRQHIYNDF